MGNVGPYPSDVARRVIRVLWRNKVDIGVGHCLEAMRKALGIDAVYGTAVEAASHAHIHRVKSTHDIPRGSLIYWGVRDGHVAYALGVVNGVPMCFSPGAPSDTDHWARVPVAEIGKWGHSLLGYSYDINGKTIK